MAPVRRRRAWSPLLRIRRKVEYFSVFTCPACGKRSRDQMPSNASVYFYRCTRCNGTITPLPGHCCVYCSFGDRPCPWVQRSRWW